MKRWSKKTFYRLARKLLPFFRFLRLIEPCCSENGLKLNSGTATRFKTGPASFLLCDRALATLRDMAFFVEKGPLLTTDEAKRFYDTTGKRILWINPIPLDMYLHSPSQLEILRSLSDRSHFLTLITARSSKKVQFKIPGVRIIYFPLRFVPLFSSIAFAIMLFFFLPIYVIVFKPRFIIATQPEVSILSVASSLPFKRLRKVKFILDIRTIPVEFRGFRGFQQDLWFSISILVAKRFFDGMTALTSLMKKDICTKFGIDPDKAGVWSSGVSLEKFDPSKFSYSGKKLKEELGLSHRFVVFYHGAATENRGLRETIESVRIVRNVCPDIVIFLLGKGPIIPLLERVVREQETHQYVIIHVPVDYAEVPKFISMSDVCIIPLPDHPFWRSQNPLKLLEYLAMEKAVVLTDIPAHRAVIGEEKCGIFLSSSRPAEIADSLAFVCQNRKKLEEWGKCGRKIVVERYSWEKVAEDLENYLLLIDKK